MLARFAYGARRTSSTSTRSTRLTCRCCSRSIYIIKTKGSKLTPFYKRLLGGFTVKGQIYGFPKDWSPLGMVANRAMLQKAGVRTPQDVGPVPHGADPACSSNAVPGGAPACLSLDWARTSRSSTEQRRVAERAHAVRDQLAGERRHADHVPRLAEQRPRQDAAAARCGLVR